MPDTNAPQAPRSKKSRNIALVGLGFALLPPLIGFVTLMTMTFKGWQGLGYMIIWAFASAASASLGIILSIVAMAFKPRSAAAPVTLVVCLLMLAGIASLFFG